MFDIGAGELLLVGAIALVVVGPEKLPALARTVGALLGRMQHFVNSVKSEIHNETGFSELHNLRQDLTSAANSFRNQVEHEVTDLRASFADLAKKDRQIDLDYVAKSDELFEEASVIDDRQMSLPFEQTENSEHPQ